MPIETIEDLGRVVKEKAPEEFRGMSVTQAGQRYLSQYPDNWGRLPDSTVARHIENLKNTKHREASGIWAFFAKHGENQRAEFFQNRVKTAQALVALEKHSHELERLGIESQAEVARAAVTIAQCKKQILSLGILGDLELKAAQHGMVLEEYQAYLRREHEAKLRREDSELQYTQVVGVKNLETDLHIKELQNSHILQKDIEKLRSELTLMLKDKEHKHTVEVEELKHQLREKEKQLEHRLKQEEIDREVEGTIRLANSQELSRAAMIQLLLDYGSRLEATTSDFQRKIYQKEIDRLEKELYGEPSGMASQANAGNEPEGGAPPADSGAKPQTAPGSSQQPNPTKSSRHIQ